MMTQALFIRGARVVGLSDSAQTRPTNLRIHHGVVTEVGDELSPQGHERVIEADGRWLIPGLWDHHVHMGQWAMSAGRLRLAGGATAEELVRTVSEQIALQGRAESSSGVKPIIGMGFRISGWREKPSPGVLDAVSGDRLVILITADGHTAWLNTVALERFGLGGPDRLIDENEWFAVFARLREIEAERDRTERFASVISAAHAKGIVGISDLEYSPNYLSWPELESAGLPKLRVRAGVYAEHLDDVISRGFKTGDAVTPLIQLGALKIIADGSLSSRTAFCCEPYGEPGDLTTGTENFTPAELDRLLARATENGLEVAVHAIGDAAAAHALDSFERSGARGRIEHAQLVDPRDIQRMAALGVTASVQPAHLLDDRAVLDKYWSDRAADAFAFASLHAAGVTLVLGSDAPVAPLDPWLAIDAAVHRAAPGDDAWMPAEKLTPIEALFASTNGAGPISVGSLADLVLLDDDPLTSRPRDVRVSTTILDGEIVYRAGSNARQK